MATLTHHTTLILAIASLLLATAMGCGEDDVDGDEPDDLVYERCEKKLECTDQFDDFDSCVEYVESWGENGNGEVTKGYDEEECVAAIVDLRDCQTDLDCEAFTDSAVSYQKCQDENDAVSQRCPAGIPTDSDDNALDEAETLLCDKRLECEDDFNKEDHDLCAGSVDCSEAQQAYHDCRMGLSCEEFADINAPMEKCGDKRSAVSSACTDGDPETDETMRKEVCDKHLECIDAFTEEHHEICLDPPDCDESLELFHDCEMALSCGEFSDMEERWEACRIERAFSMNACLDG